MLGSELSCDPERRSHPEVLTFGLSVPVCATLGSSVGLWPASFYGISRVTATLEIWEIMPEAARQTGEML